MFLGQHGDLGNRFGDLGPQAGDHIEIDTEAATDTGPGQRGDTAQPACRPAEKLPDAVGPAQVQMRVVLPGDADTAENLDAVLDIGLRGVDTDAGGDGRSDRQLPAIRFRRRACSIDCGDRGLLGTAQHLGAQVLDRLEAADRLAELLTHFGVGDGGVQSPSTHAGRLGGQHGGGQVLHPLPGCGGHRCGRCRGQHHSGQRPGEVGGAHWLDHHTVVGGVDEQPIPVGRQQQAVGGGAQHPPDAARRPRGRGVEVHVTVERHPCDAFTGRERAAQSRVGDDQGGQRGGRDRPGHQRLGRLVDHGAQILDVAARAAAVLRNGDTEQSQTGQAVEHRPPGVGLALFDIADRRGRTRR